MAMIEVRLRTFYACDEGNIEPSTTVTIDSDEIAKVPWAATVQKLFDNMCSQMNGGPFMNLRPMTSEEAETARVVEQGT